MNDKVIEGRPGENRPVMTNTRFILLSVLFALIAAGLCWGGSRLFKKEIQTEVMVFALASGFVVSTAGWFIVMQGFANAPERMMGYFGAGMLTKLVLIGLSVVLVNVFDIASLEEFFLPFATVFFLTGFAQLFITVKGATKLLDAANKGRVWEQPAAPGVARSPVKRDVNAS
jgi:hypothetical protein